jgi:hypothetical protein
MEEVERREDRIEKKGRKGSMRERTESSQWKVGAEVKRKSKNHK